MTALTLEVTTTTPGGCGLLSFVQRLGAAARANRSLLCVGLDPDPARMAVDDVTQFNKTIVDATKDLVCAYKPNLPFYEALGLPGLEALKETVGYIRAKAPDVVIVGDGKRGDIASTNVHYARALFEVWGFDAATVNCYGGGESLEPFLGYQDKGVFVWCRSSNEGAREFQDLKVSAGPGPNPPMYEWVATRSKEWDRGGNVGLVVGATYPKELEMVRSICPDQPILVPAVGAQAGDLSTAVSGGMDAAGRNVIISSSRSVLYASNDPKMFGEAARKSAIALRDNINGSLEEQGKGW